MSIIHPLDIIQHHGPCIAMPEKDEALFKLAHHSHPSSIKLFPDLLLKESNLHPAEWNLDTQLWLSQLHSRNCKTQLFKLNPSQVSPHRRKSSNCAAATDFPNSFFCLENSAVSKSPFATPILAHIPMLVQICEIEPIDFSVYCFTEKKFCLATEEEEEEDEKQKERGKSPIIKSISHAHEFHSCDLCSNFFF